VLQLIADRYVSLQRLDERRQLGRSENLALSDLIFTMPRRFPRFAISIEYND
jgi:hypothetical protein